jgi:gluconokinase
VARVLAIDIGTSSIRATVYGRGLQPVRTGTKIAYRWRTGTDGTVEASAATMERAVASAIDGALDGMRSNIDAVVIAAFWHSLVGIDARERAVTAVIPWSDTRSAAQVESLRARLDERAVHARTGCRIHTTYWPARLRWFAEHDAKTFRRVHRWITFPSYLERRWLGRAAESRSQASATGVFSHAAGAWDTALCAACGITPDQLGPIVDLDDVGAQPSAAVTRRWPQLRDARWIPAAGDGALNNVGANCLSRGRAALMIGTSGALREILPNDRRVQVPFELWRYCLDRRRDVIGGALSNGGNFIGWMRQTLGLGGDVKAAARVDAAIARVPPDSHGLTVLPFVAGQRTPDYPATASGAIDGLRLSTTREDIVRAGLESVAYRFVEVMQDVRRVAPVSHLVATGTALTASRVWPQIVADALGCALIVPRDNELTSRGAAIVGFELLGIPVRGLEPRVARVFHPDPRAHAVYRAAAARQQRLLEALVVP